MHNALSPTRRAFLGGACSVAAFAGAGDISLAAAPTEARFVVILLRGAVDGLDILRPYGDPDFRRIRPDQVGSAIADYQREPINLDGFYALHGLCEPLHALWQRGEMAFAHAVSTPYREARSHFDGQDLLETGGQFPGERRDGWLNRVLRHIPGATQQLGLNVGLDANLIMRGEAAHLSWSPKTRFDEAQRILTQLQSLYSADPAFSQALRDAAQAHSLASGTEQRGNPAAIARFAASALRRDARIAAFSVGGWDTHANQGTSIRRPIVNLMEAVQTLHADLGAQAWSRTAVLAVTEFGRTARVNGSKGTDHGTGGAALFFGGALSGARAHGQWPGLGEGALYRDRDLKPMQDVRTYAAWMLHDLFGVQRHVLETDIFPGMRLEANPGLIAV